jgi:ferredoxin
MEFGEDGRLHFKAIEGSNTVIPADTVISAIGQEPDLSFLPGDIQVNRQMISIDADGATSRPKYFAGGDAAVPEKRVAWAIGSGRRAAQAIDRYLRGLPRPEPVEKADKVQSNLQDVDFIKKGEKVALPVLPVGERQGNFAEVELGLDAERAKSEAERCLLCRGMCLVACPYGAPQFGAEDNPRMQKCDLCLDTWTEFKKPICVRACPTRAMDAGPLDELRSKYGDTRDAAGFLYSEGIMPSVIFKEKPQ